VTDVDVVIVTYGSKATVGASVRSALPLGPVFVVDHGGDGSAEVARALGAKVATDPTNPGFGAGQNRGTAMGANPFLLLLNPDAVVDADAVRRGVEALQEDDGVAAAQGAIVSGHGPERSAGRALGPVHLAGRLLGAKRLLDRPVVRRLARRTGLADHVDRVPEAPVEVDSLAATAVLLRRAAFEAVGGFDEDYFLYGEDLDLCLRLRRAGHRLLASPEVWAQHAGGASSTGWFEREVEWWRGTLRYAARWWSLGEFGLGLALGVARAAGLVLRRPRAGRRIVRSLVAEPLRTRRGLGR